MLIKKTELLFLISVCSISTAASQGCLDLPQPKNGNTLTYSRLPNNAWRRPEGSTATYTCPRDYTGIPLVRTCQSDGTWSGDLTALVCEPPPFTLDNIMAVVARMWRADYDLKLLFGVHSIHRYQYDSDEAYNKTVVEKFLLGEGYNPPTWRTVMFLIDSRGTNGLGDHIRNFVEPVQDATLTTDKVAEVLELAKFRYKPNDLSSLPPNPPILIKQEIIPRNWLDTSDQWYHWSELWACYYVQSHPMASWTHLASCLYLHGEFTAVEKLKPHLPLRDLTITTEKLVELFGTVDKEWQVDYVAHELDIPLSKLKEVKWNYQSLTQQRDAYLDLYVSDHPYPSWKGVAAALRRVYLRHQADEVEWTYFQAPPLTLDNVMAAVKEVKWSRWDSLLSCLFDVDSIISSDSDEAYRKAGVKKFLLGEGRYQPTWRAVIFCLDRAGEVAVADKIRNFGEPVQDATLTTDKVAEVLELVNDWDWLRPSAVINIEQDIIPRYRLSAIEEKYSTKRERASEGASYYVQCHPEPSWTHLANCLYYYGEFTAVEKLKPHLPLRDLTITTEKLVELFRIEQGVNIELIMDVIEQEVDAIGVNLDLPISKREEIRGNYQSVTRRRDAYLDLYVSDHPYPSWKTVARALRLAHLDQQADEVERTYITPRHCYSMELIMECTYSACSWCGNFTCTLD